MASEEVLRIIAEIERRKEQERLRYFVPNGKQEEFIRKVGEGKQFIKLFIGANGVGKTALIINILGNIIYGPQNKFFDFGIYKNWPFPKRIRIGTETKNVEEAGAIDVEVNHWWPKGRFEGFKNGKLYVSQYKTDTGFMIDKMTYQQERKEWESSTLGLVLFDEPPPKELFAACVSRMRKGGNILVGMTPLHGSAWIQDELIDTHNEDALAVFADIESNCKQHGVRGVLEHKHIQTMIDNMDPDEVEARARGKFMHLSNVILNKSFKRDVHIISDDVAPPKGCQWGRVVDPAIGKPWAIGWFWVDGRGQVVFDREYPLDDFSKSRESKLATKDYAEIMKAVETDNHYRPMEWERLDRHFGNARSFQGRTLKAELNDDFGFNFRDSYNCEEEVESGIQKVKNYLAYDESKPIGGLNFPKLLIKERCKNIIRSLTRSSRNQNTWKQEDDHFKDHFDLVRYAVMAEPEIYEYKEAPQRKIGYVLGG